MRSIFFLIVVIGCVLPFTLFGQQALSLDEMVQSLADASGEKDNGKASFYSYELAKYYLAAGEKDKAEEYLLQCISYGRKSDDGMLLCLGYDRLGALYFAEKNYSKALDNFQRSVKAAEGINKIDFIADGLINVATTHAALGRHKRSIDPLDKALSVSIQQGDELLQQKCYELLAEYHNKLGNKDKAAEYTNLYTTLVSKQQQEEQSAERVKELEQEVKQAGKVSKTVRSRLTQQTQKLRRAEDSLLATRYSLLATEQSLEEARLLSERKQLEIDLLNKDKELAALTIKERDASLKNEALIRNSAIAGILLMTALVSVVIVSYRRKVAANKKIDSQNKNIRSSINYAQRIQEAMLPKIEQQAKLLPDSFVLFKPRDAVSGDFFWFSEIKSWYNPDVAFAAVDCTGHGVPGAFMSMIGINSLNGIIARGVAEADQILNTLNRDVYRALQQETTGNTDGMDIALCIYRKEKDTLEFSGARNPLVYIQSNTLHQIKGDSHSIGGSESKRDFQFRKHLITIDKPTMIYIFSDGYRDQFGGDKDGKFMAKRFNQLLMDIHLLPVHEQKEILDKTIETWRGERHPQTDDILVMGVRLQPTVS